MAGGVVGNITTSGTGAGTHLIASTFYATCETAAATAAKVAKLTNTNTSTVTLITGMTITVKFTYSNTAASPTLTIQSSGGTQLVAAKALKKVGTTAIGATESTSWQAGAAVIFVYDGTNWVEVSSSTDAVPASGGTFTGPVTFDDSVTTDEITTGNLVATGNASFANNAQFNTINGVTVGSSPKFTDTTYTAGNGLRLSGTQFINTRIPFVAGTQTSATGSWTGVCNDITALYDGLTIAYWLPYAGSGNATLNLTINGVATGAKNCYYGGTTRLTTHYGAGNIIYLTYRTSGNISGTNYEGWWANSQYYANTVSQLRWDYSTVTAGTAGIFPYTIIMMNSSGNYESIVTSSSTGTSKSRNTAGFIPDRISFNNVNTTVTNGNKLSDSNYAIFDAIGGIDGRYSLNISTTGLVVGKPVYLVGTITNGLFYLDTTWWTQTLPSSADGKVYIYLGSTYNIASVANDYRINIAADHPIFCYVNGALRLYGGDAATVNGLTVQTAVPSGAVFTDTKNTAGSTDTSSKIFLVGATSQAANPQTYSDNQVYATNGQLDANKVRIAEAVTLQYNSTTQALDFVFA